MRRLLRANFAALAWVAAAASAADAPGTLRIDYFHTGEPGVYRNEAPFCRICQRALEQVIDLHAGPRRPD